MALRGRPPKPIQDLILHGTARKDRHAQSIVAEQPTGTAEKPEWLDDEASRVWDFIVEDLSRREVAKRIDSLALGAACEWYSRYRRTSKALDALDPNAESAYKLTIQAKLAWKEFTALASDFGLTPAARMRLKVPTERKPCGVASRKRTA